MLTVCLECGGEMIDVKWSGKSLSELKRLYQMEFQDDRDLDPEFLPVESPAFMLLDPRFLVFFENFHEVDLADSSHILVRPEYFVARSNGKASAKCGGQPAWQRRFSCSQQHPSVEHESVLKWVASGFVKRVARAASKDPTHSSRDSSTRSWCSARLGCLAETSPHATQNDSNLHIKNTFHKARVHPKPDHQPQVTRTSDLPGWNSAVAQSQPDSAPQAAVSMDESPKNWSRPVAESMSDAGFEFPILHTQGCCSAYRVGIVNYGGDSVAGDGHQGAHMCKPRDNVAPQIKLLNVSSISSQQDRPCHMLLEVYPELEQSLLDGQPIAEADHIGSTPEGGRVASRMHGTPNLCAAADQERQAEAQNVCCDYGSAYMQPQPYADVHGSSPLTLPFKSGSRAPVSSCNLQAPVAREGTRGQSTHQAWAASSALPAGSLNKVVDQQAVPDTVPPQQSNSIKHWIWATISDPNSGPVATVWSILLIAAIIAANLFYIIETDPRYHSPQGKSHAVFSVAEYATLAIFTTEIVLTIASAPRLWMLLDITFVMDVVVVIPSYMELLLGNTGGIRLSVLRVFRLLRVLRLFRVSRSSTTLVISSVRRSLSVLFMFIGLIAIVVTIIGAVMHTVERGDWHPEYREWRREVMWTCKYQAEIRDDGHMYASGRRVVHLPPSCELLDVENMQASYVCQVPIETGKDCVPTQWDLSPFESIPASMWWAVVTICTVGYGDAIPTTFLGRVAGSIVMIIGLLIIAVPITVIGNNFSEVYKEAMLKQKQDLPVRGKRSSMVMKSRVSLVPGVLRQGLE